jgi:hypothetical protein
MGEVDNALMEREVIHDFLNVSGIAGIAFMDGLAPPYFHGFAANFDISQQSAIAQSVQQVLETTPEGFNSFEFQFDHYRVYLHKLNQGITLLVLTNNSLPRLAYTQAIRRLLIELQIGQDNPIATFRSLASEISPSPSPFASDIRPVPSGSVQPAPDLSKLNAEFHSGPASELESEVRSAREGMPESVTTEQHMPSAPADLQVVSSNSISLKDVLAAINALSQFTTQYLGTMVVANYWKATRPAVDWLNHFQIERSAQMTFSVQLPSERLPMLSPSQHQCLKEWVAAFILRCSKVIRNFPKLARHALSQWQSALLLDDPV